MLGWNSLACALGDSWDMLCVTAAEARSLSFPKLAQRSDCEADLGIIFPGINLEDVLHLCCFFQAGLERPGIGIRCLW